MNFRRDTSAPHQARSGLWRTSFKDLSLGKKLRLITAAASMFSILSGTVILIAMDYGRTTQDLQRNFTLTSRMTSENAVVSLMFQDLKTAREVLQALHTDPRIRKSTLYLETGESFAE